MPIDDSGSRRTLDFTFKASVDSTLDAILNKITSALDGMGKKLETVTAASLANTRAVKEQANNLQNLGSVAGDAGEKMSKLERAFMTIGLYGGAAAVVNSIIVALRGAGDATIKFDQALRDTQAITGASNVELSQMSVVIKEVASTTKMGMDDIAKGMQIIAQSGYNAADTMIVIGSAAKLAQATLSDIGTSANLLTSVLNVFNMKATDSAYAVDVLANAVNKSKLDIDKLNTAMNYVGPIAAQAGLDIKDTAASLMVLSDAGLRASTMGTGLRQVLSFLLTPSKEMVSLTLQHGMALQDLDPRMNSFSKVLGNLNKVLSSSADSFRVFGQRGAAAAIVMARAGQEFTDSAGNTTSAFDIMREHAGEFGSAAEMADTTMKGLGNTISNTLSKLQVMAVSFSENSLGMLAVQKVLGVVQWIATTLTKLAESPLLGKLAKDIVSVTVALAAMGGVSLLIRGLVAAIGLLLTPLGAMVTGFLQLSGVARTITSLEPAFRGAFVRLAVVVENVTAGFYSAAEGAKIFWASMSAGMRVATVFSGIMAVVAAASLIYHYFVNSEKEAQEALGKEREEVKKSRDELAQYATALENSKNGSIGQARILAEVSEKHQQLARVMADSTASTKEKTAAIRELSEEYQKKYLANLERELVLLDNKRKKNAEKISSTFDPDNPPDSGASVVTDKEKASLRKENLDIEMQMAKILAEENYKQGISVTLLESTAKALAGAKGIREDLLQAEMRSLYIQDQLKTLSDSRKTEGLTDAEKLTAQNEQIKQSYGEVVAAQILAWRDSPDKQDQLRFFEFVKEDLKVISQLMQFIKDDNKNLTTEQIQSIATLMKAQGEHAVALKVIETQTKAAHAEKMVQLQEQLDQEMQLAITDVAHKEQHDVKIKKLEMQLALERFAIQKELHDQFKKMMDGDASYFSESVIADMARKLAEASKGAASAVQAAGAATRKDFAAWVKRENAQLKDIEDTRKHYDAMISYMESTDKTTAEAGAEERYKFAQLAYEKELGLQLKKVNKAKQYNQTTYEQELEKYRAMQKQKQQLDWNYETYLYGLQKSRWDMEAKETEASVARRKLDLYKGSPQNSDRIREEARLQEEADLAHIRNIQLQLDRMKEVDKLGSGEASLKKRQLLVDEENALTKLQSNRRNYEIEAARLDYEQAHERLMRGEITEQQYIEIRRKYRALNAQDERKSREERIIDEGSFWDRVGLGLARFRDKMKTNGEIIVESVTQIAEGLSDAFGNAFITAIKGTESFASAFRKMALQVLSDMAAMIMKQLMLNALMGIVNYFLPSPTKTNTGSGGSSGGGTQQTDSSMMAHSGNVNLTGVMMRGGLQLFHGGGLSQDEYMYILKKGETVRTEQQERALQQQLSGGAGGPQLYLNVINKKEDANVRASKPYFDGARWVSDMIIEAKNRGMST